jgi:mannose-6-phosphate isomerase-like protein (cupin superfamily)
MLKVSGTSLNNLYKNITMIIRASDATQKEIGSMRIMEYKINPDFSAAVIDIDGKHGKIKCPSEDRVYFILEGEGTFIIDGKEERVSKDDVILVPKNTPYDIAGTMRFFLLCTPEFRSEHDVSLE